MILRTIKCDLCGAVYTEQGDGAGFPGWGALQGVTLDGVANPCLCPEHLAAAAGFVDSLKQEPTDGLD